MILQYILTKMSNFWLTVKVVAGSQQWLTRFSGPSMVRDDLRTALSLDEEQKRQRYLLNLQMENARLISHVPYLHRGKTLSPSRKILALMDNSLLSNESDSKTPKTGLRKSSLKQATSSLLTQLHIRRRTKIPSSKQMPL